MRPVVCRLPTSNLKGQNLTYEFENSVTNAEFLITPRNILLFILKIKCNLNYKGALLAIYITRVISNSGAVQTEVESLGSWTALECHFFKAELQGRNLLLTFRILSLQEDSVTNEANCEEHILAVPAV
jgi:hypothetical protein